MINEAERILSEENRKIEEAKRVEAELIRQHEEADRAKYDATRESNENIRKQNESIRLANETNRIDEETKRVEEENKRKLAEEERNANYNFMTEDEERRRLEANAHKEAEKLRTQAENTRVNEEAKRRTTEQARVSAENTRVSNENTRKTNEEARQNNETHRVEAETQRQNRYNSFIADAEANANNFENYTNAAKVKEEERKSNELDRKSQEDRRVSNEVERISNENTRKANEVVREKNEASRQNIFENKVDEVDTKISELNTTKDNFVSNINTKVDTKISEIDNVKDNFVSSVNTKVDNKISELDSAKSDMTNTVASKVNEVETRFNALTSSQQQSSEVIDARDGETSLKARLDRDIEKAKQVYTNVEGSHISTDSSVGYLKDVEILGNTIQSASNLADIRSVGDTVEGQELYEIPVLSRGKNLLDSNILFAQGYMNDFGDIVSLKEQISVTEKLKVFPNTSYVLRDNKSSVGASITVREFDANGNFISKLSVLPTDYFITSNNTKYIAFNFYRADYETYLDTAKLQLEEGTQATPYEPYQEDKLTILSPVQLEKVGDIADRVICKDGVWGVEKNIGSVILNGTENWGKGVNTGMATHFNTVDPYDVVPSSTQNLLNSKYPVISDFNNDRELFTVTGSSRFIIKVLNTKIPNGTVLEFTNILKSEPVLVKYQTTQPQFIPLPHDQQIKLRTFANKTNISFLTEIEGTIKAQVPKSLGATVNTHTEQINNLNKELDRVKKLEESTVSTVTTESDFTTVEATSNGYFEDVKLEGKTLVNLGGSVENKSYAKWQKLKTYNATIGKIYTSIIKNTGEVRLDFKNNTLNTLITKIEPNDTISISFVCTDSEIGIVNYADGICGFEWVLLEGDHTQNPPNGCIEGLKSVGQSASEDGVDEIVVSSVNGDGNLFDVTRIINQEEGGVDYTYDNNNVITVKSNAVLGFGNYMKFKAGKTYYFSGETSNIANVRIYPVGRYEYNDMILNIANGQDSFSGSYKCTQDMDVVFRFWKNTGLATVSDVIVSTNPITEYTPHQSDKKRLLYYNTETQTWEKPILREWDSIEKHADGKYYYHQRSAEIVLNGSENWGLNAGWSGEEMSTNSYYLTADGQKIAGLMVKSNGATNIISEVMPTVFVNSTLFDSDCVSGENYTGAIYIRINKSKVLNGIKPYLQQNPMRVVYQLAQEKVYECTNIDLITYNGETNYIVESGAIVPRTTLKVHSNISNVVSLLQKKVSLLESDITNYMITQNRLMLASRYNADTVSFKVDVASFSDTFEYDNDLYELILNNILVGKDNYNREYIENLIIFYWMDFIISDEMYSALFEIIEEQHNPKIEEETPLI